MNTGKKIDKAKLHKAVSAWREADPHNTGRWSFVSSEHKYLWNINAKVACVTVTRALRVLEGIPHHDDLLWDDPEVLHLSNFSTDEVVDMLSSPDWYRFCFVRNPYDKLFSAYKSKLTRPIKDAYYLQVQDEIREMFDYPVKDGKRVGIVSFRDFVRFLQKGRRRHDIHWCLQVSKLRPDLFPYDFVGRFETFKKDFRSLLTHLGASAELIATEEPAHGKTPDICLPATYDRKLADTVYKMFREDFETFGYERDSWMYM